MKILGDLRVLLLCLASTSPLLLAQVDAREIIRHAVAADEPNWRIAPNYTFLQRVELRRIDAQGRVKLSEVRTCDLTVQQGTPYRQMVQRDDQPLPATDEKREQESLARNSRYSSVPADARAIHAAEGRVARSAVVSQFAKATP